MTSNVIPDSDHVARYCKPSTIDKETKTPTCNSFMLRSGERYVSVNWLEHLEQSSREDDIKELRKVLKSKMTVKATGLIAELNVGNTKAAVLGETNGSGALSFTHEPSYNNNSHSGIYWDPDEDNMAIAQLIADTVIKTYKAK